MNGSTIYDKSKTPAIQEFRNFTLEELKNLDSFHGQLWAQCETNKNKGKFANVRKNGQLKKWKRDPNRLEQGFKYGLYESFRLTTEEMLTGIFIEVEKELKV